MGLGSASLALPALDRNLSPRFFLNVESRSGAAPRRAPFPDPAHQTGRADLPHPAFGQGYLCFRPRQVSAEAFQAEQAELLVKILIAEAIAALSLDLVLVT